jgi:hypothetical protein
MKINSLFIDEGFSVQQTRDGGYIIVGGSCTWSSYFYEDVYLIKTDSVGNLIWEQTYGGHGGDCGYCVRQTQDGGFIITGYTESFSARPQDVVLIKTDSLGNIDWAKAHGGISMDYGRSIILTQDGGYIILGYTSLNSDFLVIKTNYLGDTLWTQSYGGFSWEVGYSIKQTNDGGYILAGITNSFGVGLIDAYLIRLAAESTTLNISLDPLSPPILIPANGGSFDYTASVQRAFGSQSPFYVWARDRYPDGTYTAPLLGPVQINPPVGVTVTRQRTQVVPGSWPAGVHWYVGYASTTVGYPATDADSFSWTKNTARDGGTTVWEAENYGEPFPGEEIPQQAVGHLSKESTPLKRGSGGDLFTVSPSPFNASTAISFKLQAASQVSLKIYDTAGRLVANLVEGWRDAGEHSVRFDGSKLAAGVYLVRLEASGSGPAGGLRSTTPTTEVQKIVLLK